MDQQIAIYLAGKIQKGHETPNETYWSQDNLLEIERGLNPAVPVFLNPALRSDNLQDQLSVFGRDMTQVFCADVVFVDARDRRGLGVGAEMMWAKMNQIPVVTLAPINTHYRHEKTTLLGVQVNHWVHPFVECLSDLIVSSPFEGAENLEQLIASDTIKGAESILEAIEHYKETNLESDLPMQEIFKECPRLFKKLSFLQEV